MREKQVATSENATFFKMTVNSKIRGWPNKSCLYFCLCKYLHASNFSKNVNKLEMSFYLLLRLY